MPCICKSFFPSCLFFHLSISSLVNSSAPLCLCHVCYSCASSSLSFLSLSWLHHCLCHVAHSSGLNFFAASERQMMGCPAGLPGLCPLFSAGSEPPGCGGGQCWYLGKPQVFGAVKRNHVEIRDACKKRDYLGIWGRGGGPTFGEIPN